MYICTSFPSHAITRTDWPRSTLGALILSTSQRSKDAFSTTKHYALWSSTDFYAVHVHPFEVAGA